MSDTFKIMVDCSGCGHQEATWKEVSASIIGFGTEPNKMGSTKYEWIHLAVIVNLYLNSRR